MPIVSWSLKPDDLQRDGPFIDITIGYPSVEAKEASSLGLEIPSPLKIKALIDTGAAVTIINPSLALSRKLRQTGFAEIVAAGSSGRYAEYATAVTFPESKLQSFDPIRVVACQIVRQPISCLIGRDILRHWKLRYDGPAGLIEISQ
jgi:hypothetical protein